MVNLLKSGSYEVPTTNLYQNMISESIETCEAFLKDTVKSPLTTKHFETYSTRNDRYHLWDGSKSCDNFKQLIEQPVWLSEEEKSYPIAYSLLIYDDVEWTARLLRLIYRPNNLYCIHVDRKSPEWFYEEIVNLSRCFGVNVLVVNRSESIRVVWGHYSVVEGFLACSELLFNNPTVKWQYLVNINGKELPLRTNWELVAALKALNMSNIIDCARKNAPEERIPLKQPNFVVKWTKGSFHAALRRDMVDYILHDKRALEIRKIFKEEENLPKIPDELFFSTLAYNPQLEAPGACLTCHVSNGKDPRATFVARYKIWWPAYCASRRIVRGICIFGIQHLHNFTQRTEFFVNKFNHGFHEFAYDCLEYWILKKMKQEHLSGELDTKFNTTFYSRLFCSSDHI
ncbi:beta-1,3-galactosyl-O-glycosyl-glycoprotein beta-1,6-N-acetylglucosaminyltransferase [Schistosoma bovis]|uniref:Beta-1,3-galactosyl-O-glycosyl-glycoprotein beta-1,6-N-acetylglucosaminyltransferase n=1 Tax=Schistosoma bovis TaxID=6184 RepID=A0A430Q345_SCHBO|nr:beta-1,3-galactosyl-O-glycosyl-glycoprotein beta-1,6-N-acetylglucosaminyltransferase [Schistosoma bovis]